MDIEGVFRDTPFLARAFKECGTCAADVYARAKSITVSLPGTPREFRVCCGGMPPAMMSIRRNLFSTFFQAACAALDVPLSRRYLYGKINYLFRIWVTAADNLLDDEDKAVLDVSMPGDAHVMRQVVSIMAADRVLAGILREAVRGGVISAPDADRLSEMTLQVLLPSAAEEASEEKGVRKRPEPGYVLKTIHRIKTGFLFHVPLIGPQYLEKRVDRSRLRLCRAGLGDFGIGCQLLDDVRDIARDHLEQRHNYVLSTLAHSRSGRSRLKKLEKGFTVQKKVFKEFSEECAMTVRLADRYLHSGLASLDACGFGLGPEKIEAVARFMFTALDIEEARSWLKK
jgi:hypothetical protein